MPVEKRASVPARGYSWAPFRPGHTLCLTHGADHAGTYGPLADELARRVTEEHPGLADFPYEVSAWATVEARAAILRLWLDALGPISPETREPRDSWLTWCSHFERRALEHRRELGLTPAAAARLRKDLAASRAFDSSALQALQAEGRKIREKRTAELPAAGDETVDGPESDDQPSGDV